VQQGFFLYSFLPFFSFFHHPMFYSIPLSLNVTDLHYSVYKKAVYSQTSKWLVVC
jgi:hypothetical protein